MTKAQYFEMCEELGSEPIDSEIPVDFSDLLIEVQEAMSIYNVLQDNWDYMGGNYIGKNLNGFKDILEIYDIPREDYKSMYELILWIDRVRSKLINTKKQQEQKARK